MKKIFVFTFIATLALCALQLSGAEAPKDTKEANKLAREGAEASKNQEWNKAIELLRKSTNLEHKYPDKLSAVYHQRDSVDALNEQFQDASNVYVDAINLTH